MPQPEDCFSAQGGTVELGAEPAPGRTGGPVPAAPGKSCHLEKGTDSGPWYGQPGPLESPSTPTGAAVPSQDPACAAVPHWALRGLRPSCHLGPVQATPPCPLPAINPQAIVPTQPHSHSIPGANLPRPGAQTPKPSRKRTSRKRMAKASGLSASLSLDPVTSFPGILVPKHHAF